MRFIAVSLAVVLLALQYSLWIADDGLRELWRLEEEVALRTSENEQKAARNAALEGEVIDLKQGLAAVEEKARSELGMVGADETFYLVTLRPRQASNTTK
jgi:cell division protein FtsB